MKNRRIITAHLVRNTFIVALAIDVFLFQRGSDIRLFGILALWVVLQRIERVKTSHILYAMLFVVPIQVVLTMVRPTYFATERISHWIYVFLIILIAREWNRRSKRLHKEHA